MDIKLIKNPYMLCAESSAASYAAWNNRNYEMMFTRKLGFKFATDNFCENSVIGNRISLDNKPEEMAMCLYKYHGIAVDHFASDNIELIFNEVLKQVKNNVPVSLYADKLDMYLAIDSKNDNEIICIDIHSTPSNSEEKDYVKKILNLSELKSVEAKNPYYGIYTYSISGNEKKDINTASFFEELKELDYFANYKEKKLMMMEFAGCIKDNADFQKETEGYDNPFFVPLINGIIQIASSKKLFSYSLQYVYSLNGDGEIYDVSKKIANAAEVWELIRQLLIKAFYAKNFNDKLKVKIIDYIKRAADFEEEIIESITNYAAITDGVNFKGVAPVLKIEQNKDKNDNLKVYEILAEEKTSFSEVNINKDKIVPVNIDKYFNNIAFGKSVSIQSKANFTGTGYYFISENAPTCGCFEPDNLKFKFPSTVEEAFDNISCDEQEIEVTPGLYNSILLLGTAEYGDFVDSLTVEFENGRREKINMAFSEWWRGKPIYNEKIAWRGKIVEKKEDTVKLLERDHFIYSIMRPIGEKAKMIKIFLPFCPNMHIFSISLGLQYIEQDKHDR